MSNKLLKNFTQIFIGLYTISIGILLSLEAEAVTIPNPLKFDTLYELVDAVVDTLIKIAAPIAILMIIWSAFLFLTSGGDTTKIKKAKDTLLFTLIGFAVLVAAEVIIVGVCKFFAEVPSECTF